MLLTKTDKRFLKILAILVGVLSLVAIWHFTYGEQFIRSAYQASLSGHPTYSFIDHNKETLEHYLQREHTIVWEYLCLSLPLTLLFWFLIIKLIQFLMKRSDATTVTPLQSLERTFKFDWVVAIALYAILVAIYFFPCFKTLGSALIGAPEDNMSGYWSLWWAHDKVFHGNESLTFSNEIYYPQGSSLYYFAWSFYNLGINEICRLFCNGVASFNLVILHTFVISGLGAFLLAKYVTKNSYLALLAGFIFAFSPNHFARAQHHIHINSIQFIPFFVLFYLRSIRESSMGLIVLAALFFLLNSLCEWTYMIMALYFIAFAYLYLALKRKSMFLSDVLRKSATIVIPSFLILSVWLLQMVKIGLSHREIDVVGRATFVTDFFGLFVPSFQHWLGYIGVMAQANHSYTGNSWEVVSYLGLAAIVVVVVAARKTIRQISLYLLGALAFLLLAFGPQLHALGKFLPIGLPYTVVAYIPFLANLRAPARFMVYVYLFWSLIVVISLGLLWIRAKSNAAKWSVAVLLPLLILGDFFSYCPFITPVEEVTDYRAIKANGVAPFGILNLPYDYRQTCRYMMYQTIHDIPIVEGAATRKLGVSLIDTLDFVNLVHQKQQLIGSKVQFIAVHKLLLKETKLDIQPYLDSYPIFFQDSQTIVLKVY